MSPDDNSDGDSDANGAQQHVESQERTLSVSAGDNSNSTTSHDIQQQAEPQDQGRSVSPGDGSGSALDSNDAQQAESPNQARSVSGVNSDSDSDTETVVDGETAIVLMLRQPTFDLPNLRTAILPMDNVVFQETTIQLLQLLLAEVSRANSKIADLEDDVERLQNLVRRQTVNLRASSERITEITANQRASSERITAIIGLITRVMDLTTQTRDLQNQQRQYQQRLSDQAIPMLTAQYRSAQFSQWLHARLANVESNLEITTLAPPNDLN
jgi:hypothetical protein